MCALVLHNYFFSASQHFGPIAVTFCTMNFFSSSNLLYNVCLHSVPFFHRDSLFSSFTNLVFRERYSIMCVCMCIKYVFTTCLCFVYPCNSYIICFFHLILHPSFLKPHKHKSRTSVVCVIQISYLCNSYITFLLFTFEFYVVSFLETAPQSFLFVI